MAIVIVRQPRALLVALRVERKGGFGAIAQVLLPPRDPDFWFENATFEKKSWWHAWSDWIAAGQKQATTARKPGGKKNPVLEAAPGSYVLSK